MTRNSEVFTPSFPLYKNRSKDKSINRPFCAELIEGNVYFLDNSSPTTPQNMCKGSESTWLLCPCAANVRGGISRDGAGGGVSV